MPLDGHKHFPRYSHPMTSASEDPVHDIPEGHAKLVRTISQGSGIAVRTLIGSQLIAEAMNRRKMAPTAANALGRALMGAVLIAVGPASADPVEAGVSNNSQFQRELR